MPLQVIEIPVEIPDNPSPVTARGKMTRHAIFAMFAPNFAHIHGRHSLYRSRWELNRKRGIGGDPGCGGTSSFTRAGLSTDMYEEYEKIESSRSVCGVSRGDRAHDLDANIGGRAGYAGER
jgi:hypothetical protein